MGSKNLDLAVHEVAASELSLGGLRAVDLSIVELENVTTPDLSSFLTSVGTGIAVSGLIIAT
jgi:hypothetical protein